MIVFDADDTDQLTLFVSFQAEDEAKLLVETDRAFAA
jgi:hypothetical protein